MNDQSFKVQPPYYQIRVRAAYKKRQIDVSRKISTDMKHSFLAEEEVEEFIGLASVLLINIGTLSVPWVRSMHKVAAKARELGKPWVLDPVGVGATNLRTKTATELVLSYKPTAIRGNPSEITALAKSICKGLDVQAAGTRIA